MNTMRMVVLGWASLTLANCARGRDERTTDHASVRAIVERLEDAWNKKDAVLFSEHFAETVDYVTISGLRVEGRETLEQGHRMLFAAREKDTTVSLSVSSLRHLRSGVVVVSVNGTKAMFSKRSTRRLRIALTLIMVRGEQGWKIEVFQNTPVVRSGEEMYSPTGGRGTDRHGGER